jgi:hypothetical protein
VVLCGVGVACRLVAVLSNKAHVFVLRSLRLLCSLETAYNELGVVAMSQAPVLALPSPPVPPLSAARQGGSITVYSLPSCHVLTVIHAHSSPLRHLCLSSNGRLLASASERGTLIRLFHIPTGDKRQTVRRGSRPAHIHSITINTSATVMAVASEDSATIHLFALNDPTTSSSSPSSFPTPSPSSVLPPSLSLPLHTLLSFASSSVHSLPPSVSDLVEPQRSACVIHLAATDRCAACSFTPHNRATAVDEQEEERKEEEEEEVLQLVTRSGSLRSYQLHRQLATSDEPSTTLSTRLIAEHRL